MRIFFWSADSSGCAYYRCELPAGQLTQLNHDVMVSTLMPLEWMRTADVIVGQRVSQPGASQRWQQMAKEGRAKLVYEVDDDLLDIDPSNRQAWVFFSRPDIRANIIRNLQVADLITVSTEPLAEVLSKYNKNISVLPNCIPAGLLDAPKAEGRKGVVYGWSGGASHRSDLEELGSNLSRFVRRHPEVSIHVMGDATAYEQLAKGIKDHTRFTPWVESVPGFHAAIDFDVTLAPLRASSFNRSKSAIRCLEAAALAIPVVASDFGPYAEFVRHGETGLLVRRPHEWSNYLKQLLDPVARLEMGAKARALAAQHTIESNIELWEKALEL